MRRLYTGDQHAHMIALQQAARISDSNAKPPVNGASAAMYQAPKQGIVMMSGIMGTGQQHMQHPSSQAQAQQYQHISIGIKSKQSTTMQQQNQQPHSNSHQKSVSNASSIAYPFQTASISANLNHQQQTSHHISQSHHKQQRAGTHLVGDQIYSGSKNRNEQQYILADANENLMMKDVGGPPMISIQQTTLHNKSPSPRGRGFKAPQQPGSNNNTNLQIGINSLMQGQQHRNTKQMMTDPTTSSQKAKDAINQAGSHTQHQPYGGSKAAAGNSNILQQQVVINGQKLLMQFGTPQPQQFIQSSQQSTKDEKDLTSKRTIAEGFRKNEIDHSSGAGQQQNQSRVQSGIQQRRFQTQKNSRQPASRVPASGQQQQPSSKQQAANMMSYNQEMGSHLTPEFMEQLDEETLSKINTIQQQLQSNQGVADKNQILHLYRMSIGQKKPEPQLSLDQNSPDSIIKVNSILAGGTDGVVAHHPNAATDTKKRFASGVNQNYSASNNQRANLSSAKSGQPQQVPRSAQSSTTQNTHYNNHNLHMSTTMAGQSRAHGDHQTKRESYNFVSQQQKQSVNSQEKLRRNLSKEYCPMIIKSTNKNLQGANNAQIVKGVLQQQKSRADSSLNQKASAGQSRSGGQQQIQQYVGTPAADDSQSKAGGSGVMTTQPSEILKTKSHNVLMHRHSETPGQTSHSIQQRFIDSQYEDQADLLQASPVQKAIMSPPSNANGTLDNRFQKSLDVNTRQAGFKESLAGENPLNIVFGDDEYTAKDSSAVNQDFTNSSNLMNRKMKIVDLVTPSRADGTNIAGMLTSPMQSQSLAAINDLGGGQDMVDADFSPQVSPLRKHEADQPAPLTGEQALVQQQSDLPTRQGSHMQQVQMMSSMNRGLPHADSLKKNNHGSAMTSLKSPNAAEGDMEMLTLQQQLSLQQAAATSAANMLSSKQPLPQQSQTIAAITDPTPTSTMNSHARMQMQPPQRQQANASAAAFKPQAQPHPSQQQNGASSAPGADQLQQQHHMMQISQMQQQAMQQQLSFNNNNNKGNAANGNNVTNQHPQYKLVTPSQQESAKARMAQQMHTQHTPGGGEQKMARAVQAQRTAGVRGSSTLAQTNTMNNNANSQTNQAAMGAGKQQRTASHNRNNLGSSKQHAAQQAQQQQQDVAGANSTAHGGFLRPKVLDFQPKSGQIDPLQAHRSRKRGTLGGAGHNHNHAPAINMSTGSAFNQNLNGAARFNAGNGVFRHF